MKLLSRLKNNLMSKVSITYLVPHVVPELERGWSLDWRCRCCRLPVMLSSTSLLLLSSLLFLSGLLHNRL